MEKIPIFFANNSNQSPKKPDTRLRDPLERNQSELKQQKWTNGNFQNNQPPQQNNLFGLNFRGNNMIEEKGNS